MAKAILIKDKEFERIYKISTNELITLRLSDEHEEIVFIHEGKQFGEFEFTHYTDGSCKITRMYTNNFKHMGLGRVALQFIKDAILNFPIWVSPNDGNIREDGSHLTGDALGFVKKMIEEKLIDGYDDGSHTQGEDG